MMKTVKSTALDFENATGSERLEFLVAEHTILVNVRIAYSEFPGAPVDDIWRLKDSMSILSNGSYDSSGIVSGLTGTRTKLQSRHTHGIRVQVRIR